MDGWPLYQLCAICMRMCAPLCCMCHVCRWNASVGAWPKTNRTRIRKNTNMKRNKFKTKGDFVSRPPAGGRERAHKSRIPSHWAKIDDRHFWFVFLSAHIRDIQSQARRHRMRVRSKTHNSIIHPVNNNSNDARATHSFHLIVLAWITPCDHIIADSCSILVQKRNHNFDRNAQWAFSVYADNNFPSGRIKG